MNKEYFVDKELYDNLSASFSALEIQLDKYKNVIDKIRNKIKENNEYLENRKEMYSQHDDELVKVATLQLIINNLVQNDDILELLEEVE